jgi:hypothetical protein
VHDVALERPACGTDIAKLEPLCHRTRHLGESVGAWPRLNRSSKGVAMGVASREATSATRKKVQLAAKSSDAVTILPALADAMHAPGSADRSAGSRGARITNSEPDAYEIQRGAVPPMAQRISRHHGIPPAFVQIMPSDSMEASEAEFNC